MDFVITLIADPKKEALTSAFADSMAAALSAQGVRWLAGGTACDIPLSSPEGRETVESLIAGHAYDYVIQPGANRRKKLLIADMESTIVTCECLDELAALVGLQDKIAAITARAMNGELEFESALRERVSLLAGLRESALQQVMDEKVRLMPGARELVSAMKAQGAYCMLVSGGFDFYTGRIATMLGFDEHRSNRLEIRNGKLTGEVIPPVLGKDAKLQALRDTCARLKIAADDALAVGDGANDLPMLLAAGLGVAYHAKPNVRAQVRARIDHCDLSALLYLQEITPPC